MTALRFSAMASRHAESFSSSVVGGFGFGIGISIAFRPVPARALRTPPCFDLDERLFSVPTDEAAAAAGDTKDVGEGPIELRAATVRLTIGPAAERCTFLMGDSPGCIRGGEWRMDGFARRGETRPRKDSGRIGETSPSGTTFADATARSLGGGDEGRSEDMVLL